MPESCRCLDLWVRRVQNTFKTALLPASLLHLVLALLVLDSLVTPAPSQLNSTIHCLFPNGYPRFYFYFACWWFFASCIINGNNKSSWSCLILTTADRVPPFQQAINAMHVATAKPVRTEVSPSSPFLSRLPGPPWTHKSPLPLHVFGSRRRSTGVPGPAVDAAREECLMPPTAANDILLRCRLLYQISVGSSRTL
jgi:hypothetical protein